MNELQRDKLIKILGMLGSSHDGEVLQAARQAQRMVVESGSSWQDLIVQALKDLDIGNAMKSVDRRLRSLPSHDQKVFLEMRERYFANRLSEVDRNRLRYFVDCYVPGEDDDILF